MEKIWDEFFGSSWGVLSELIENTGAFLADRQERKFRADKNALKLLGLTEETPYEEFFDFIKKMQERLDVLIPVKVRLVRDDEKLVAGYVYVHDLSNSDVDPKLAVIDQTKLIRIMGGSIGEPLLFIMQIEGINNPAMQDIYIYSALRAVREHVPYNTLIAYNAPRRFWVCIPEYNEGDELIYLQNIQSAVEECVLQDDFGYVVSKHHSMTITAGLTSGNMYPAERMHAANAALYKALSQGRGSIVNFTAEISRSMEDEYILQRKFNRLIEYNLFLYHFQPIISARTGKVLAYEMLMRTDRSIDMNPMQILDVAQKSDRLYDVEYATMYNGYRILSENPKVFAEKKLYINSISGYYLTEGDFTSLVERYGAVMDCSVIEFTEQTELSGDMLDRIRKRLTEHDIELAIDDYGTGYSNTTNLMRYNPLVVKIDRELISGIDNNNKMMNIVENLIEFLHNNGYLALAEGVETYEELKVMIGLGADYIQGFYVAKPAPEFLEAIDDEIVEQIVRINTENGGAHTKVYKPVEKEIIILEDLVSENYTSILVDVSEVTLKGTGDHVVPLTVTVKDEVKTRIILDNAKISSPTAMGVLSLGRGTSVEIELMGDSIFDKKGINVPVTSSIRIMGAGNLEINSEALNSYGIGNECKSSHGDITLDMPGSVTIRCNGENCIGIGAGRNTDGKKIRILQGIVTVDSSGGTCVGVGTTDGGADLVIQNCKLNINHASAMGVGIGSIKGDVNIDISNFRSEIKATGTVQTFLGVVEEGKGRINVKNGKLISDMKGERVINIGTNAGNLNIAISHVALALYSEGHIVCGVGDEKGAGDIDMDYCELNIRFVSANSYPIGSGGGRVNVTDTAQNIDVNE